MTPEIPKTSPIEITDDIFTDTKFYQHQTCPTTQLTDTRLHQQQLQHNYYVWQYGCQYQHRQIRADFYLCM